MMMSKLQPNEISHSESYNLCAANSYELSMNCVTEILYKKRIQPMSSQLGPSQRLVSRARADVKPATVNVKWSGPKPMSSRLGPDQCRAERARTEVESPGPELMSSRLGLDQCRAERARAVSRAQADVESIGPRPMSS
ncbi:hypothetical protein PHAVU_006G134022 [Phaseolus vulgaris]|uniref:Uncharacterized protein n=1 Tax=Phaseolus vulgaris TaxID=3885 RepID=V7CPV8_PHAVU|nr:hypothetical protein PHAVU_002G225200g [Phaseolus vulgaris]ESW31280.1 hypothetical protein PHAVU_002G225200g [Phaseolus vulgaris]